LDPYIYQSTPLDKRIQNIYILMHDVQKLHELTSPDAGSVNHSQK